MGRIQTRLGVAVVSKFSVRVFFLLLVRFQQTGIIIVKHRVQGRNDKAWVGVEPSTLWSWSS